MENKNKFPTFKELVIQSWEILRKNIRKFLSLWFVVMLISGLISAIVVGITIGIVGFGAIRAINFGDVMNDLSTVSIGIGILIILLLLVLFSLLSSLVWIGNVLIVAEEKLSLKEIMKKSSNLVIPFMLTSFILGLIIIGGYAFLIIPGIIFSILFIFTQYELVIGGKKNWTAMKSSAMIVCQNFGDLLLKFLVLYLVLFGFMFIVEILENMGGMMIFFATLVQMIFNLTYSALSIIFGILVYKAARERTDFKLKKSFRWVWIIAIVGLGLGVFWMGLITKLVQENWEKSKEAKINSENYKNQLEKKYREEFEIDNSYDDNEEFESIENI